MTAEEKIDKAEGVQGSEPSERASAVREKAAGAMKWSFVAQLVNKLVSPLTQIVLAHILVPEAFGVVATITMVTTFSQTLADAGFQKYLIQHEFRDTGELGRCSNVAFWSNLAVALSIWAIVAVFRNQVASFAGSPGAGDALAIACFSLPLNSFISVQLALCQRFFDFELVFKVKLASALLMALVSIPAALFGSGYWSLIIGALASDGCTAMLLFLKSSWRPGLFYRFSILRSMLSFSLWSLSEAVVLWAISWVGVFIIGSSMSTYYLGIYKNSVSITNNLLSVIESSVMPVFYSGLSRMQMDKSALRSFFYASQRALALFLLPVACGVMLLSNLVVVVLLGSQWLEGKALISWLAIMLSLRMLFCYMGNQTLRAVGKPGLITFICFSYLIVYVPFLWYCTHLPFEVFSVLVPCGFIPLILIELAVLWKFVGLSPSMMLRGLVPIALNCIAPSALVLAVLHFSDSIIAQLFCVPLFVLVYFFATSCLESTRGILRSCLKSFGLRSFAARVNRAIDVVALVVAKITGRGEGKKTV